MRKFITSTIILFVCIVQIRAQETHVLKTKLETYFKIVRDEIYAPSPDPIFYSEKNAGEMIQLLQPYLNDSIPKIRLKANYLIYKTASRSLDKELRKTAVHFLVQALKDKDSGNVGNVADNLTSFYTEDFDKKTGDSLKVILHNQILYRDKIIKLAAFVGLKDQMAYMNDLLQTEKSNKIVWSVRLALARLGDAEQLDFCMNLIKQQPVNDDLIYELAPDLIFMRQQKSFEFLLEILNDNAKKCYSANPEDPKPILCAYRVMEYLAPVIKDFPVEVDEFGDIITADYEQALKMARDWFKEHIHNFEIIRNTY